MPDCMTAGRPYQSDLWIWRAARTDPSGVAEDNWLTISTSKLPQANVYSGAGGTVWIKVVPDDGTLPYRLDVAVVKRQDERPRYLSQGATGSMADVKAKGRWERGRWTVEFSRRFSTGNDDDVALAARKALAVSVSVFNAVEGQEHSVSKTFPLVIE
jgi:hypothetical protein